MTINLILKHTNSGRGVLLHACILLIFHLVGLIGFSSQWRDLFLQLTPFHLLLVFGYLVLFQQHVNGRFLLFMVFVITSSFLIELVGVQTGKIFGDYKYGEALGIKIGETPLLIGVLWFVLIYGIGVILKPLKIHWVLKSVIGASMMLAIDLFIEPVAIELGFWSWADNAIPLQNYLAWFIISFLYMTIFFQSSFSANRIAPIVYWMQLGFFMAINLLN